jgi:hypothetical protein
MWMWTRQGSSEAPAILPMSLALTLDMHSLEYLQQYLSEQSFLTKVATTSSLHTETLSN